MTAPSNRTDSDQDALLAEAEAAEAEAAAAEAAAEAARARARAADLRRRREQQAGETRPSSTAGTEQSAEPTEADADTSATPEAGEDAAGDADSAADTGTEPDAATPAPDQTAAAGTARRRYGHPAVRIAAFAVAALLIVALLTLSGLIIWQHKKAAVRQEQVAEFSAAARRGVVNLMSLDFNNADADLQRVVDSTTGEFHDDFQNSVKDFMTVMKESQVVSTAEVKATGVQSLDGDSAVVLVAARSEVANEASKQPTSRAWRLSVTLERVSDGIKMSKVEFTP